MKHVSSKWSTKMYPTSPAPALSREAICTIEEVRGLEPSLLLEYDQVLREHDGAHIIVQVRQR